LVTGPAGSGKTTVSNLLAKAFEKSAVIEVDTLRHMVKGGLVKPWPYSEEVARQTALGVKNACDMARNCISEGFVVFIDDVVGITNLDLYYRYLEGIPFKTFLLLPSKETVRERDAKREVKTMGGRALELHDQFSEKATKGKWQIIDSSNQSAQQTCEEILGEL
jgi:adenylylsulfate kinase-like enzyme